MKSKATSLIACLILFTMPACYQEPKTGIESDNDENIRLLEEEPVSVTAVRLRSGTIERKVEVFGHLLYQKKKSLSVSGGGVLIQSYMRQGQWVKEGELLAEMDAETLLQEMEAARLRLELTSLKKNELLILFGGEADSDDSVDSLTLRGINLQSGYLQALLDFQRHEHNLKRTMLRAPFDGVIANVAAHPGRFYGHGQPMAEIISTSEAQVKFKMLYGTARHLQKGFSISAKPVVPDAAVLIGQISEINPEADEQGMIEIRASLQTPMPVFLPEGLAFIVEIKEEKPAQFVVPRSALVMRSGQQVIITVDTLRNRSVWHTVEILDENEDELSVSGNLRQNDWVLTGGHVFLNPDSKVVLAN